MNGLNNIHRDVPKALFAVVMAAVVITMSGTNAQEDAASASIVDGYQEIEWTDLMPDEDLQALLNPPGFLDDIADGSADDVLDSRLQSEFNGLGDSAFSQALTSTDVVPDYDGKAIRLPGFIVPLAYNSDREVTEFFLVPFFGACIHYPPPPPNQIIHASYPDGFELTSIYDPFWLSGTLSVAITSNEVATAAYSITVDKLEIYEEGAF